MSVINSDRAQDAQHYWRMMREVAETITPAEFRDEIEVLALHTESDVLKTLCLRNRRRFEGYITISRIARA